MSWFIILFINPFNSSYDNSDYDDTSCFIVGLIFVILAVIGILVGVGICIDKKMQEQHKVEYDKKFELYLSELTEHQKCHEYRLDECSSLQDAIAEVKEAIYDAYSMDEELHIYINFLRSLPVPECKNDSTILVTAKLCVEEIDKCNDIIEKRK